MVAGEHPLEKATINSRSKKRKTGRKNRAEDVDPAAVKQQMVQFLRLLGNLPSCYNLERNEFNKSCTCCQQFHGNERTSVGYHDSRDTAE